MFFFRRSPCLFWTAFHWFDSTDKSHTHTLGLLAHITCILHKTFLWRRKNEWKKQSKKTDDVAILLSFAICVTKCKMTTAKKVVRVRWCNIIVKFGCRTEPDISSKNGTKLHHSHCNEHVCYLRSVIKFVGHNSLFRTLFVFIARYCHFVCIGRKVDGKGHRLSIQI